MLDILETLVDMCRLDLALVHVFGEFPLELLLEETVNLRVRTHLSQRVSVREKDVMFRGEVWSKGSFQASF